MDIALNNLTDVAVYKSSEQIINSKKVEIKDIVLEPNNITKLIKRAIKTPKGYIKILNKAEILSFLDSNYGSDIYKYLSEGLTINLVSDVKRVIKESLSNANLNTNIEKITLSLVELNKLNIIISYTDNSNVLINLDINN